VVRWIVDGMNVIGSRPDGWWKDRHGAMVNLVGLLDRWAATQRCAVTVVFERPPAPPIVSDTVEVTCAPHAAPNSADDEIVRLVREHADPRELTVVTSDSTLADRVRGAGAAVESAGAFRRALEET
jgi:predicted RNA-binding protein with PIN domain